MSHSITFFVKGNLKVKRGKRPMDMFEKFPVAHLDPDQLQKILTLEKELRNETNENIVLIAYDEQGEE